MLATAYPDQVIYGERKTYEIYVVTKAHMSALRKFHSTLFRGRTRRPTPPTYCIHAGLIPHFGCMEAVSDVGEMADAPTT